MTRVSLFQNFAMRYEDRPISRLERKAQSVRDAGYHQPLREPEYGVEHLHDRLDIGWPVGRSNSIILDSIEGRN